MLDWMHAKRCAFLDAFSRAVTWLGSLWLLVPGAALCLGLLLVRREYRAATFLGASLATGVLLVHAAKRIFRRPRPENNPPVVRMPRNASFPSAHTVQITCFCLPLASIVAAHLPPPWGWGVFSLAAVLIVAVGLSRVYLQVHYLSDVVAGVAMGGLVVVGVSFVFRTG